MKLLKNLLKNYRFLFFIVVVTLVILLLINRPREAFNSSQWGSKCRVMSDTIEGTCPLINGQQYRKNPATDMCEGPIVEYCTGGFRIFRDKASCRSLRTPCCIKSGVRKEITRAPAIKNYECPSGYERSGSFMCVKVGKMGCRSGFTKKPNIDECYRCPNINGARTVLHSQNKCKDREDPAKQYAAEVEGLVCNPS